MSRTKMLGGLSKLRNVHSLLLHERINKLTEITRNISAGKSIVIYTSVFSSFEPIHPILPVSNKLWDTFIITDHSVNTLSKEVNRIETDFQFGNPRMTAKYFKLCPHLFFPQYRYSLYIDANCVLKPTIHDFLIKNCKEELTALFFPHNKRKCAYDECRYCFFTGKETVYRLLKIWTLLRTSHYPKNLGLIQGGFILRQHNRPEVKKIMEEWWRCVVKYTERDQLLFNYLAWKRSFQYGYLHSMILHDSPYTSILSHRNVMYNRSGQREDRLRARAVQMYIKWKRHRYVSDPK